MNTINVAEVLDEAADWLDAHGWCRNNYVDTGLYREGSNEALARQLAQNHASDPDCRVCVLGACLAVTTVSTFDVVCEVERRWYALTGVGPATFNDYATSKREVVDEMRRVATALREESA